MTSTFPSGCDILLPYHQRMKVPAPHPRKHLLWSDFLVFTFSLSSKCVVLSPVVLTCISPVQHLFMCLFVAYTFLVTFLFKHFAHLKKNGLLVRANVAQSVVP